MKAAVRCDASCALSAIAVCVLVGSALFIKMCWQPLDLKHDTMPRNIEYKYSITTIHEYLCVYECLCALTTHVHVRVHVRVYVTQIYVYKYTYTMEKCSLYLYFCKQTSTIENNLCIEILFR